MYWGSKVPEAACLMLVQRYDDDVLCDETREFIMKTRAISIHSHQYYVTSM
jgi:hypothetical protein